MRSMQHIPRRASLQQTLASGQRPKKRFSRYLWRRKRSHLLIHTILLVVSALFVFPVLLVVAGSFSSEHAIALNGYALIPQEWSLQAYQFLFSDPQQILNAYGVSIAVTLIGTAISLLMMSLLGYVMSRRDFRWRQPLSFLVLFTMLFNGGLVPIYLLMTTVLHVQDTLLAYMLPYLIIPMYVLLLRTYFAGLPSELLEAAKLDGAGELRIFIQIVVPMSQPALATVGLLCMLLFWNDWFQGLLYISDPHLMSLQYLLYQISQNITMLATLNTSNTNVAAQIPTQSTLMAMAVIAIGPIVLAFLFTQRYFIRGITLGGLKGN